MTLRFIGSLYKYLCSLLAQMKFKKSHQWFVITRKITLLCENVILLWHYEKYVMLLQEKLPHYEEIICYFTKYHIARRKRYIIPRDGRKVRVSWVPVPSAPKVIPVSP